MTKPSRDPKSQADWIATIGEPTRLAMIRILVAGEQTVTALAQAAGVEIVNVSRHLIYMIYMKESGLVTSQQDGRFMITVWSEPRFAEPPWNWRTHGDQVHHPVGVTG